MELSLRDIAAMAGLSQATVSRVINGSRGVRAESRARVQEVLAAHRYAPDLRAVSLARGQSAWPLLALTLPRDLTPHFLSVLSGVREALAGREVQLLLRDSSALSADWRRSLLAGRSAGVLILGRGLEEGELDYYRAHGISYLLLDWKGPDGPALSVDDEAGGALAADWLAERGARRPFYLGGSSPDRADDARWVGFRAACSRRGIEASRLGVPLDGSSSGFLSGGAEAVRRLPWDEGDRSPDGLFFYCDQMALGAWAWLRKEKPCLPVIGYDGWEAAAALGIPAVVQPSRDMGRDAALILLDMMGGKPFPAGIGPYRPFIIRAEGSFVP